MDPDLIVLSSHFLKYFFYKMITEIFLAENGLLKVSIEIVEITVRWTHSRSFMSRKTYFYFTRI